MCTLYTLAGGHRHSQGEAALYTRYCFGCLKMMRETGDKFQRRELKECIRMTSVSCTSEPQVIFLWLHLVFISSPFPRRQMQHWHWSRVI